jgi:predicted transcriptional regulator
MQSDYKLLGKILASNHRLRTLSLLAERVLTPAEIANRLDLELSHVSKTLRELQDFGLVECKNPTLRKGRLFALTPKGKQTIESLHALERPRENANAGH